MCHRKTFSGKDFSEVMKRAQEFANGKNANVVIDLTDDGWEITVEWTHG